MAVLLRGKISKRVRCLRPYVKYSLALYSKITMYDHVNNIFHSNNTFDSALLFEGRVDAKMPIPEKNSTYVSSESIPFEVEGNNIFLDVFQQ